MWPRAFLAQLFAVGCAGIAILGGVTLTARAVDAQLLSSTFNDPPENLMAGMTGEMNIITGKHENVLLLPTRALVVDQALIVKNGLVQSRTVRVGYRTLDFSEIVSGLSEGERAVLSDQDKLRPWKLVRQRVAKIVPQSEQR